MEGIWYPPIISKAAGKLPLLVNWTMHLLRMDDRILIKKRQDVGIWSNMKQASVSSLKKKKHTLSEVSFFRFYLLI